VAAESLLLDELCRDGRPIAVACKAGRVNLTFVTRIIAREQTYSLNSRAETTVEALRLDAPTELKIVQRRRHFRVNVSSEQLFAKAWRIDERRPGCTEELEVAVRDLSIGGMGVTFIGKDGKPPDVICCDRVAVQLRFGESVLRLEGRVCGGEQNQDGPFKCGVQWSGLQETVAGRHNLDRLSHLIGQLERIALRQERLAPAA
jgi:c-di-GMP-binding flagellar brake protein YcgR